MSKVKTSTLSRSRRSEGVHPIRGDKKKPGGKPHTPVNEQLTIPKTIRFNQAQFNEFTRRGGADWLRKELTVFIGEPVKRSTGKRPKHAGAK